MVYLFIFLIISFSCKIKKHKRDGKWVRRRGEEERKERGVREEKGGEKKRGLISF